ncbi:MAG: hypothetical protein HYT20_02985 [Candidatus Nealsonbacteria bacterium]|nr:hypothetical protein [Candidatus Nealsonbacteria bacterium]
MVKKNKKIKKIIKVHSTRLMASKKTKKTEAKLIESETVHKTKIRVIGIGGGGCSIVAEVAPYIKKVDFIAANADIQALKEIGKKIKVFPFGQNLTRGLGCGMDPKVGKNAAQEAEQKIASLFKNVDLAILVSSLGGGTGSGAAPEFARIAKELGVMTFGIFTMPFKFEGVKRAQIAKLSLEKLKPYLNIFSTIPNENIFKIINKDTPITESFSAVNKRLSENLRGLIEMIYFPGLVNIDFADLRTILDGKGKLSYLNSSISQGQSRAEESIKELLGSPLNEYNINGAEKILFNITASKDLGMAEVALISRTISDFNRRAKIIFGVSQDNDYKENLRVTLLAVGCGQEPEECAKESDPEPDSKPKSRPKTEVKKPVVRKKKQTIKKKSKKAAVQQVPLLSDINLPTRKNGLDLKKEAEKTEQELFEEEKKWEIPAFLRREENQ